MARIYSSNNLTQWGRIGRGMRKNPLERRKVVGVLADGHDNSPLGCWLTCCFNFFHNEKMFKKKKIIPVLKMLFTGNRVFSKVNKASSLELYLCKIIVALSAKAIETEIE